MVSQNTLVGQATDYNIVGRMRIVWCITKATNTRSEYFLELLYGNSGYANAPLCYVIRTLPLFFLQDDGMIL